MNKKQGEIMERTKIRHSSALPYLLLSLFLFTGSFYSSKAAADNVTGQQLAYFVGYHTSPGYVYHGPRHSRANRTYWTGWRAVGHGCRRSCLVDRWSGRVIRCKNTCTRHHRRF